MKQKVWKIHNCKLYAVNDFDFFCSKISHYQDPSEQRGYHTRPQTSSASTTSTSWSSMTPGGQQFPQLSLCTPQPPAASAMQQQHKPSDFLRANHRGHKTASALPHASKNNVLQQRLAVYYNCKSHPCTTIHLKKKNRQGRNSFCMWMCCKGTSINDVRF